MNEASPRHGHTLVELMIVVTFFSLLMLLATRLIVLAYGSQRAAGRDMVAAIGLDRLADQFQGDVRSAEKVLYVRAAAEAGDELPPPWTPGQPQRTVVLRLQVAGAIIEYAEAPGIVYRAVLPAEGNPQVTSASEQFRLSGAARLEIEKIELKPSRGGHQVLALAVRERAADGSQGTPPRLRIQAVLGADLRFAHLTAEERP